MTFLSALVPPAAMLVVFLAVAFTAYRATDGARRPPTDEAASPTDEVG